MTAPREHGILFRGDMVRALLRPEGDPLRKGVTRRASDRWDRVIAGDLLWVRETWAQLDDDTQGVVYRADEGGDSSESDRWDLVDRRWRPSIHMPRWASRLTLRVTSVRREPGFTCSRAGGPIAPACWCTACDLTYDCRSLPAVSAAEARLEGVADRRAYLALWRAINGETYPAWLWRIAFEVVS